MIRHGSVQLHDFDFQHQFAVGLLDLVKKGLRKRHILLGAANGEGVRGRVQLRARNSGHLANHPNCFIHFVGVDGSGQDEFLFDFERVVPHFLWGVFGDEHAYARPRHG